MHLDYTLIGGPTCLLEVGGLRILVDPTFDPPMTYTERVGRVPSMVKTAYPAVSAEDLGKIDVTLISHDQHIDHLDYKGREVALASDRIFTTVEGAERLGGQAIGLEDFASATVDMPAGGTLTVTGVRAQHGPDPIWKGAGQCSGFVLRGDGIPSIYVSGDNYSIDVVHDFVEKLGQVDIAVMFGGGVRFKEIGDGVEMTMPYNVTAEASRVLGAKKVIPAHIEGWAHFSEGVSYMIDAFEKAGLADKLVPVELGITRRIDI